jgi:hypothetical protein
MESGKKAVSVVALVTALVVLQLVVAPTAMARSPQGMKPDGSVVLVSKNGTEVRGGTLWGIMCFYRMHLICGWLRMH